jgi:hypothetical protein
LDEETAASGRSRFVARISAGVNGTYPPKATGLRENAVSGYHSRLPDAGSAARRLRLPDAVARAAPAEPMNAPLPATTVSALDAPGDAAPRLREIPYNYTSFSDREIVV